MGIAIALALGCVIGMLLMALCQTSGREADDEAEAYRRAQEGDPGALPDGWPDASGITRRD